MTFAWDGNAVEWRGEPSFQLPSDLFEYARLIHESKPDWIVETGGGGGTTQFLKDTSERGVVVGVKTDSLGWAKTVSLTGAVMVILDSNVYDAEHMLDELVAFGALVTVGQHMIVCHTNREDWGSKPALDAFLKDHGEKWGQLLDPHPTLNPGGYLKRLVA